MRVANTGIEIQDVRPDHGSWEILGQDGSFRVTADVQGGGMGWAGCAFLRFVNVGLPERRPARDRAARSIRGRFKIPVGHQVLSIDRLIQTSAAAPARYIHPSFTDPLGYKTAGPSQAKLLRLGWKMLRRKAPVPA